MSDELTVEIWRSNSGSGRFQTYQVPRAAKQTILDVVTYVQRELDSTLSYRYSCRVGMCGTCAMVVNDRPCWTCRTQASSYSEKKFIRIAPLRNLPPVKDLVVDMNPFFDKWQRAGGGFASELAKREQFAKISPRSSARKAANEAIECIGCGVCYAACDVVKWKPGYLGPAALNRAWTLMNDERAANKTKLRNLVAEDSGCLSCHTTQSCTQYCPKQLDPSGSIAAIKRTLLRPPE